MPETQTNSSVAAPSAKGARRARAIGTALVVVTIVLGFLDYIGVIGGNIHTVVPGHVYRSAELTGHNLDDLLTAKHIRTVINLRGGSVSDAWYRSELQVCRADGADHVDITMSARHLPDPAKLKMLLTEFDTARYPVLFHCKAGSDRTGLAATIYMDVYQHVPLDKAEDDDLTWRYGHFRWGETHAMNDFFDLYRQNGHGQDLRTWILQTYPAIYRAHQNS